MPVRGATHEERLENFYATQAEHYDAFRKRLLHGRTELYQSLDIPDGAYWVDFGGGTGANLECRADDMHRFGRVEVVDLSSSLLEIADRRIEQHGWDNVQTTCCDVTKFEPDRPVDVVTFSYSLTMIPDWFRAINQAMKILKPGGTIGVVDFYVSRKHPEPDRRRHWSLTQWFWPTWFRHDNVFLSPDHLPYLSQHFDPASIHESSGGIPWVPLLRVPYYRFVGTKSVANSAGLEQDECGTENSTDDESKGSEEITEAAPSVTSPA